jgi:hypothetical protein
MEIADVLLLSLSNLSNPVTPWIVLGMTGAGWLAAYFFASGGSRS